MAGGCPRSNERNRNAAGTLENQSWPLPGFPLPAVLLPPRSVGLCHHPPRHTHFLRICVVLHPGEWEAPGLHILQFQPLREAIRVRPLVQNQGTSELTRGGEALVGARRSLASPGCAVWAHRRTRGPWRGCCSQKNGNPGDTHERCP